MSAIDIEIAEINEQIDELTKRRRSLFVVKERDVLAGKVVAMAETIQVLTKQRDELAKDSNRLFAETEELKRAIQRLPPAESTVKIEASGLINGDIYFDKDRTPMKISDVKKQDRRVTFNGTHLSEAGNPIGVPVQVSHDRETPVWRKRRD